MSTDPSTDLEQDAERLGGPIGLPTKINRWIAVLQYYRWDQISRRLRRVITQRIFKKATVAKSTATPTSLERQKSQSKKFKRLATAIIATESPNRCSWDGATHQLTLLNSETEMSWPIDWSGLPTDRSHLWRFQLHYQEYLLVTQNTNTSFVWEFVQGWVDAYPPESTLRSDDSWHPYCISRRLPVWIWLLSTDSPGEEVESKILQSIVSQANHLADHLELELGGNHLLENLTALAIAGLFLDGPAADRWLGIVNKFLKQELERQVLEHGEHFELSPMYHCQVLGNLLRIYTLARGAHGELEKLIMPYATRMLEFLGRILHPDGKIPLLNDSGFDEAPSADQIRSIAQLCELSLPTDSTSGRVGNYFIFADEPSKEFLLFDVGPVGANELPAHAHCDLLTFELSVGGNRWFVDSGNYNYQDDSMRAYCRSTLAHNAPNIDRANCCDVWSKFRMGRRGKICFVDDSQQGDLSWCVASHDGYASMGAKRVSRLMANLSSKSIISCIDHCENEAVSLQGHLHLAPEIKTEKIADSTFRLRDVDDNVRFLSLFGVGQVEVVSGWYCPSFGSRIKNKAIRYTRQQAQYSMAWLLSPDPIQCSIEFEQHEATLNLDGRRHSWRFSSPFVYQDK